ncbi:MAG: hypothetical protein A3G34_15865 [Candidatus Lindowbacteria bacterium RIFCSPLOWO2_12_FULL_62_27]|nr:MAG: hypothetical protein A3G34_15865 [Candidatus Lindowbacteria bacterium RIFCSPLOWO2_12_FULL_62_27]OGH63678.1 MAG: hypothetical protein A3I06_06855 [Candidatus Lindowbacteria bacterium RIFCSPLOWO2_02_FULL_62_12]
MTPEVEEETALSRAALYGLFSRLYREAPTAEILDALKAADMELDIPSGGQGMEELAVEFTRLFLGPGPHISPYESVHAAATGQPALLWGPQTSAVRRFIEAMGLSIGDETFIPDHVSVEFELMQRLVEREARARREEDVAMAEECLKAERKFLSEHLGAWFPKFAGKVAGAARLPFYRQVTDLAADFLEKEEGDERGGI